MTTEETWFFLGADDEQCGPVSRAELVKLVKQGHVPDRALVWRPGFDGWRPIRDVQELKGEESPADKNAPAAKAAVRKAADHKASVPKAEAKATPTTAALHQLLGQAPQAAAPKVAAAPQPKAPPQSRKSATRRDRTPVAIGAVLAVVAVAAVAAMYRYSSPSTPLPQAAAPVAPQPEMEIPAEAPPAPAVVRVKNPFDNGEVFEFPPGTSKEEARERVADILMKRATERQKHFDARTRTTKRR